MITYRKLFSLLYTRGIRKGALQSAARLSSPTMAKLAKGEPIRMDSLDAICRALQCQPGDILEWVPDKEIEDQTE